MSVVKVLVTGLAILAAFAAGVLIQNNYPDLIPGSAPSSVQGSDESAAGSEPLYWVAPMDANYRRDKAGKSPMGMDLVPVYEEAGTGGKDDGGITISPAVINNLGVRTATVESGPLSIDIDTVGYVGFDEDQLRHIHSRVDGWIEKLSVKSEGEAVKAGETLYELYSPELVNAQEEYLSAARAGLQSLKRASVSRLRSLGLTQTQISELARSGKVSQRIRTKAEIDGFVSALNVREGMFIQPATEVMSIGSLTAVWITAEVLERQAGFIEEGLPVQISVSAAPGRTWEGVVDYVYPVLDKRTRSLRVRIRVDNADLALKPNMFATLVINPVVSDDTLSVPNEAVIRGGDHSRVVVAGDERRFRSAIVKTGTESGGRVEILEGLAAGDRVVTSGQFLIDSETAIDPAMARMTDPEAESMAMPQDEQSASARPTVVQTTGEVKSMDADIGMIEMSHQPIPEWQWPSMEMAFTLEEGAEIKSIAPGDKVRFTIEERGEGEYVASDFEAVQADSE